MSWANRRKSQRQGKHAPKMCAEQGCVEQVGPYAHNTCEECHRYFCYAHVMQVTSDGVRLRLCRKCAGEREPTQIEDRR